MTSHDRKCSPDEESAVDTVLEALLAETMEDVKTAVNREAQKRGSQPDGSDITGSTAGDVSPKRSSVRPPTSKGAVQLKGFEPTAAEPTADQKAAPKRAAAPKRVSAAEEAVDELDQIHKHLPKALLPSVDCLERLCHSRIAQLDKYFSLELLLHWLTALWVQQHHVPKQ